MHPVTGSTELRTAGTHQPLVTGRFLGEFEDPCPHIFILSSALEEEGCGPIMNSTRLDNGAGRMQPAAAWLDLQSERGLLLSSSALSPGEGVGSLRWDHHTALTLTLLAGLPET